MAGVLGQIEREIVALERATDQLAEELEKLYGQYLKALGQSVQQQLITASYHLCTQAYPDRFLTLSFSQRQKLQQALRKLGRQAEDDLQKQLKCLRESPPLLSEKGQLITPSGLNPRLIAELAAAVKARIEERELETPSSSDQVSSQDDSNPIIAPSEPDHLPQEEAELSNFLPREAQANAQTPDFPFIPINEDSDNEYAANQAENSDAIAETEASPPAPNEIQTDDVQSNGADVTDLVQPMLPEQDDTVEAKSSPPEQTGPRSPMVLAQQQMRLEHQLRSRLRTLSQRANQVLKNAEILPDLPEPLLAAAAEAEAMNDSPSQTPNLLNVLVEMPHEDDERDDEEEEEALDRDEMPDPASMTHLMALNLRLSEIEFVDTKVSLWRTKVREKLGRLKRLAQQYQKKQRERAIAEAESAWRSSWYED